MFNDNIEDLKISACLMVKNEEEMLPGCLDSIKNFVNEIVIVDTGSDDRTIEIAESYGAKIYHHPWEHDFSKHRNQSISYATGDWILIIDADERFESLKTSASEIKQKLKKLSDDVHAILFTVRDFSRQGRLKLTWKVSRLFRNDVGFHYEGGVHNQPIVNGKMADSDLIINHYGYDLSKEKMEKKFERSNTLLQERISANEKDYEAYFYLSNMYSAFSHFKQGAEYGKKCLKYLPDHQSNNPVYLKVHYNIGASFLRLENFPLAKEYFEKGLKFLPNDVDLFYGMVMLGIQIRNFELIEKYAKLFLDNIDHVIENKESVGSRFMFNLDSDFKKGMLLNYLEALLYYDNITEVDKTIDIYSDMLSDKHLAIEVLEKFNDCHDPSLFIKYSLIFSGLHPDDSSLLKPIIINLDEKRIDASVLKNSIIEYSKGNNYEVITKLVILSMHLNKLNCAEEITTLFSEAELPKDIHLANNTIIDFYNGSKEDLVENTRDLIQHGYSDIDYYLILIPHLYISGNFELLQDAIELIIPKYEDFEDIPDIILLPLAKTLLNNNNVEFFIQVIQVITSRFQEFNDNIINSVSDLGTVLLRLSKLYLKQNRMQLAEFSLDVAFSLTNDPMYIEKRGQVAFNRGDFRRSLEYYSEALDQNIKKPGMIKNMSVIFEKYGDESGKNQCEKILAEL